MMPRPESPLTAGHLDDEQFHEDWFAASQAEDRQSDLEIGVLYVKNGLLCGWAVDRNAPERDVDIEVFASKVSVGKSRADRHVENGRPLVNASRPAFFFAKLPASGAGLGGSERLAVEIVARCGLTQASRKIEVSSAWIDGGLKRHGLEGYSEPSTARTVRGWVWFPSDAETKVDVAIFIDGHFIGRTQANQYRDDLASHSVGQGEHGFKLAIPPQYLQGRFRVDVLIAELGHALTNSPLQLVDGQVRPANALAKLGWWLRDIVDRALRHPVAPHPSQAQRHVESERTALD